MTLEQWESLPPATPAWGAWSHTDHLLAEVADRIAHLQWTLVMVNSEQGKGPKPPKLIPRPGVGSGPPAAVAEIEQRMALRGVAILKAREARGGAEPTADEIEAMLDKINGGSDV